MSSAANIETPGIQASGKEGTGTPRPNAVALEVPVNATGAKASGGSGSRDLFSEETTTVLVFKDGAVIRLEAPVSVGQLLFLTYKTTNQEVVCQVLKKKAITTTSSYVELQFTEEYPDYWGVSFAEKEKSEQEFKAAEQVQAEAVTAQEPETPVAPHTAEDLDQLKREVEVLREQLRAALQKTDAADAAAKAAAEAAARDAAAREAARAKEAMTPQVGPPRLKEELAPVNDPSPVPAVPPTPAKAEEPELLMPSAKKHDEPARPIVGMSLPVWKMEKSPEEQLLEEEGAVQAKAKAAAEAEAAKKAAVAAREAEELLPKPALDFSKAPQKSGAAGQVSSPEPVYAPKVSKSRLAALSVVLVLLIVGGVWYGKWWQYLPLKKRTVVAAAAPAKKPSAAPNAAAASKSVAASPAPVTLKNESAPGASATLTNATPTNATPTNGTNAGAPANAEAPNATAAVSAEKKSDGPAASAESAAAPPEQSAPEPVVKNSSAREKAAEKRAKTQAKEQPSVAEATSGDGPLVTAKLLKAATPVYPPDAMRNYITGDVKAEVTVKASGRVGEVKVISGPQALREAAVEALRQYEYAPATQGGKAVESKTMEVVKFWFNP